MLNKELLVYLDDFLQVKKFKDFCHNGIQIEGKKEIKKIVTAVSCSLDVILKAIELKADAIIVHHGIFWNNDNHIISGIQKARIENIIKNNINIYAYHLPLDAHEKLGNNKILGDLINAQNAKSSDFSVHQSLLWKGSLNSISGYKLKEHLESIFVNDIHHVANYPNEEIETIAWCTGAAQDFISEAYDMQVDAFITGEYSERTYYLAKEMNMQFYACGHHATEIGGIKALGSHISEKFGLNNYFMDTKNPF